MTQAPANIPLRVRYRAGLGLMVSLLMTVTVTAIGYATYVNTRKEVIRLTQRRVQELLNGLDAQVQSHLRQAVTAVQLSNMLIRSSVIRGDSDALARHFTQILRTNPSFSWASYGDELGNFSGAYRDTDGDLHVSQTTTSSGGTSEDYIVEENDQWKLRLKETNYGYDPRQQGFYNAAKQSKKLIWIGPFILYDEGVPGITCAEAHQGPNGQVRGVFSIDFDLNFLSQFVRQLRFGDNGRVFIFMTGKTPQDRDIVAYPGLKRIEATGQGAKGKLVTVADIADPALRAFTDEVAARLAAAGKTATQEQFSFQQGGVDFLGGYRTLEIENGPRWLLGAVAPQSDFLGVLAQNRNVTLLIMSVALAAGLMVALMLARRISGPLTSLAREMEEIGTFQLPNRQRMKTIFREVAAMDEALLNMKGSLRSFANYVPRDLVRAMLASGQEATLQGQTRQMTIYFSDIVGMTTIAEGMNPDQLVQHLSRYFDEMTQLIESHGGTVDKFIGDAIMAFWGAPIATSDHAARACETAVWSQRKLAELRAAPETPWLAQIRARIGVASGDVLVGNVGSHDRFNYTVMGDIVNLASRLESLNKHYGTSILISDPAYQAAKETVIARPIDLVQVLGKSNPVEVWEPLCLASDDDPAAREVAELFRDGLAAYVARDFQRAESCYHDALRLRPHDPPALLLQQRCRQFQSAPPPEHWDGVYVATEK